MRETSENLPKPSKKSSPGTKNQNPRENFHLTMGPLLKIAKMCLQTRHLLCLQTHLCNLARRLRCVVLHPKPNISELIFGFLTLLGCLVSKTQYFGINFGILDPFGGPRARAPSFPIGYFLETRVRILTTPTFKEKLSLQASRPFPEGAPRKVSMFKIYLAGRSSDMSISCPETIFFSPKWRDSGCGFFEILRFQEHKVLACQEQLLACQDTSFLASKMP